MEVMESKKDDVLIVKIVGRLDSNTYEILEQKMNGFSGEKKIIIDFSELDYISSAGLRVILISAKKAKKIGGTLRLCGMKDFIKEIFDIAGFSKILFIDTNIEDSISLIK